MHNVQLYFCSLFIYRKRVFVLPLLLVIIGLTGVAISNSIVIEPRDGHEMLSIIKQNYSESLGHRLLYPRITSLTITPDEAEKCEVKGVPQCYNSLIPKVRIHLWISEPRVNIYISTRNTMYDVQLTVMGDTLVAGWLEIKYLGKDESVCCTPCNSVCRYPDKFSDSKIAYKRNLIVAQPTQLYNFSFRLNSNNSGDFNEF